MREAERLYMDPTLEQTLLQMREEGEEQEMDEEEQAREDQQAKLFWDGVKLCGIVAVGFGLYGLFLRGTRRLFVVLLLEGSLFLLASICATYQWAIGHGAAPRPKFPDGALSILSWSAALSSLCWVRLLWSSQYGGESLDLDFGPRVHDCGDHEKFIPNIAFDWTPKSGDESDGKPDCEPAKTLAEVRGNIIGHCTWGLVAWLLFPASERLLYRCHLAMLGRFASLWLVAYPLYNWLKRTLGSVSPAKYFSVNSFCKTGIEWAVGFFVAVALGFLCTALEGGSAARLGRGRRHSGPDRRHPVRASAAGEGVSWLIWWCRLESVRQLLGIFLAVCVFSAAVQMCYTWTTVPEGYPDHSKPPAQPERGFTIGAQLLLAPTLFFSVVWVFGRER